jgi:hypothetical protein
LSSLSPREGRHGRGRWDASVRHSEARASKEPTSCTRLWEAIDVAPLDQRAAVAVPSDRGTGITVPPDRGAVVVGASDRETTVVAPPGSCRRRAVGSGRHYRRGSALHRRAATVTPSDREVTVAAPSDLGLTVGRATGGRHRHACLGGRPTFASWLGVKNWTVAA